MNILWEDGALDDFKQITTWFYNDRNSQAAEKFIDNVFHCIELLIQNPLMGHTEEFRNKKLSGYRSLVIHPHYKIVYKVNPNNTSLDITAIWDCRQDDKKLINALLR